jgi:CheY-like chemotaxis protein
VTDVFGDPRDRSDLRVLVVDDDDDQRFLLRRLFARAGITDVSEAADGAAGIAAARAVAPDLVVLDLTMPVLSGLEALPVLREVASCPIVVLSNLPAVQAEHDARAGGAVGYLEKRRSTDALVDDILLLAGLVAAAHDAATTASHGTAVDSPRDARRFVQATLAGEDADLLDVVTLLVSELVTNSNIHAGGGARVVVRLSHQRVRVDVADDDPRLPALRVPDDTGPGGRGLLIVDRAASRWGVEPAPVGKSVWFEIDRAGGPADGRAALEGRA